MLVKRGDEVIGLARINDGEAGSQSIKGIAEQTHRAKRTTVRNIEGLAPDSSYIVPVGDHDPIMEADPDRPSVATRFDRTFDAGGPRGPTG
eukprot:gene22576-24170_t